jgi:hypothetical protein
MMRSLGRHWLRWEYNIKMDIKEIGYEDVNWIQLGTSRLYLANLT